MTVVIVTVMADFSSLNIKNAMVRKTKKALFLDRDGVLNLDDGYTHEFAHEQIMGGSIELIKFANKQNFKVLVITNQAGIGRGFYSEKSFHKYMKDLGLYYKQFSAVIDDYYFAPFYRNSKYKKYLRGETLRKPNTGMIEIAKNKYNLDLKNSILVGDKISDIQAGHRSQIKNLILFGNNSENISEEFKFFKVQSLYEILDLPVW